MSTSPRFYSPYDESFWSSVSDDAASMQRCSDCEQHRYPPSACCPNCLSTNATWEKISGIGHVLSWTTLHKQYLPAYPAPTTIVAARLEEGPIFLSNIDGKEVNALKIGAPVKIIYGDHPDGYRIPRLTLNCTSIEAKR